MELNNLKDDELIPLRVDVEREIRGSVGILHTLWGNWEAIAIKVFKDTPGLSKLNAAQHGTKNVDANSRNGERYSIKTIQKAKKTGTVYPDSQEPNKQLFEYLLIVKLAPDLSLEGLYEFTWEQFLKVRAWDKRMNAWYVPISKNRLELGKCLYTKDMEP